MPTASPTDGPVSPTLGPSPLLSVHPRRLCQSLHTTRSLSTCGRGRVARGPPRLVSEGCSKGLRSKHSSTFKLFAHAAQHTATAVRVFVKFGHDCASTCALHLPPLVRPACHAVYELRRLHLALRLRANA